MSLQTDQANIAEVAASRDARHALSTDAWDRFKQALLSDSFLFATVVCRHADLIPEIHAPISYLVCGLTDRLIETLDAKAFDSYVTRKIRAELWRRNINWRTPEGRAAVDSVINGSLIRPAIINIRIFRRAFKSSVVTHAGSLFIGTNDPNETIKITHAIDPKAWEFCMQIGKTVDSGTYRDFFPERVPQGDFTKLVTQKRIELGGRTISHPQTTIQAAGYGSREEAAHYSTFITDDLIADERPGPDDIANAVRWQKSLTGFYMPTRRIRRIEVGTKHDEDDDDTYLTTGRMAEECFTLRVPIEEYEREVTNITERGRATIPSLFPKEKITAEQISVLSGDHDEDGYRTWWNQYLLSATGGTLRLFPSSLVDDPDRWWVYTDFPATDRYAERRKMGHYLIARYARDLEGRPLAKDGDDYEMTNGDGSLADEWRKHAKVVILDPWRELDRVIVVDPSWANGGASDNWGVSAVGCDNEDVLLQLDTLSDTDGLEGWIEALAYLDSKWHARVIGFDGSAMQDAMIQSKMKSDKRLRRLASRMVKVPHNNVSKPSRMQEGVAQPMWAYKFLLAPPRRIRGVEDAFGGNKTRDELKHIKSTPKRIVKNDTDGIADSLSMARVVIKRRAKTYEDEDTPRRQRQRQIDPVLGVSYAA